ncbi:MAG: transglycosylase SLT domain-containing protein [Aquificaceae bacterium]
MKIFLPILALSLFTIVHSQTLPLPEEYRLLSQYLKDRDVLLGEKILRDFPRAVFSEDLKLMIAEDLYKIGKPDDAKGYIQKVDIKRLMSDMLSKYAELWKELGLSKKEALLSNPSLFRDFIGIVELKSEEALYVAEKLIKARYYEDALKLLVNFKKEDVCYYLGLTYYNTGNREHAKEVFEDCQDERVYPYLTRLYIEERNEDAVREVLVKVRSTELRDSLLFFMGRYYLYTGEYEKAKEYIFLMTDSYERYFNLGLLNFIDADYEHASFYFMKALYLAKDKRDKSQASFWVYKSYFAEGKENIALRYLVEATKGDGFYSVLAKVYVGEPIVHRSLRHILSDNILPSQANVIKAIKDAGFYHYSRLEAFERLERMSPSDIVAISRFDPFLAIKLAINKKGYSSQVYNLVAFPTPYDVYVYEASEHFDVPTEVIWAVMRQESLFDPNAVSSSKAKGLMQLMDSTASWIAKKVGLRNFNIYDPKDNIKLGTAYLRHLYDYWGGDLVRVLASYNAGENRVNGWRNYRDTHVFIETIPYEETRNFVKKVLYNFYVYRELLSLK